jgi:hypothetical protein
MYYSFFNQVKRTLVNLNTVPSKRYRVVPSVAGLFCSSDPLPEVGEILITVHTKVVFNLIPRIEVTAHAEFWCGYGDGLVVAGEYGFAQCLILGAVECDLY